MEPYLAALYGAGGALVPDVLKLINDRFGEPPAWLKKQHYWLGASLLVILGAVVAWLSAPARALDAAALGYAAPTIVAGLFGKKEDKNPNINMADTAKRPGMFDVIRTAWARR